MRYVTVVGSRTVPYTTVGNILTSNEDFQRADVVLSGGAKGVDTHACTVAIAHGKHTGVFPANWSEFRKDKSAGYKRNVVLAEVTRDLAAHLIIIWDGQSKGTKHWIDTLIDKYKLVYTLYIVKETT